MGLWQKRTGGTPALQRRSKSPARERRDPRQHLRAFVPHSVERARIEAEQRQDRRGDLRRLHWAVDGGGLEGPLREKIRLIWIDTRVVGQFDCGSH
jgi:hypothetical protein